MENWLFEQSLWVVGGLFFGIGALAGVPMMFAVRDGVTDLTEKPLRISKLTLLIPITGMVFAGFALLFVFANCQQTPEVRPARGWLAGRLVFHLLLLWFLLAITATDAIDYVVPDFLTLQATLFAVVVAAAAGDLQLIHVWVDWNQELPGVRGPFLPEWLGTHPHWHGLLWSLSGVIAGAGTILLVKLLARWILGKEALGSGDVTLAAMIGAFLGWQATAFVLFLAPVIALVMALPLRLFTGVAFLPFGPALAAAAILVASCWRWLWMAEIPWAADETLRVRDFFGDATGLLIVAGLACGLLIGLLTLLRLYHAIPVERRGP